MIYDHCVYKENRNCDKWNSSQTIIDSTYHPVLPKKNKVDGRVISSRSNIAFKK